MAVEAAQRDGFDLVLMDCHMPELDGLQAAMRIRALEAEGSRVPIVALTASVMKSDRDRCFLAGMDDYLSKPVKIDALEKTLDRWVTGTSAAA